MKNLFMHYKLGLLLLLAPSLAQGQWILQTTLAGDPPLWRVKAVSKDIAWTISSNSFAYRTTDGGQNWQQTALVTSTEATAVIEAIDSVMAFVGGAGLAGGGNANLYRTTDAGQSWDVIYTATGSSSYWNMIQLFDSLNGIAMSDPPDGSGAFLIVKTTDGGNTWAPIANPPVANTNEFGINNAFQFYDNMNGWFGTGGFGGGMGGRVFRTTDGGETWTGFASGNPNFVWSVNFVSPTIGVRTSGSSPYLTRTTDGGQTWTPVTNLPVPVTTFMGGGAVVSTPTSNQIWVYGEATSPSDPFMITSTDGGQSWQQQTLPPLSGDWIPSMSAVGFGDPVDSVRVWAVTLDLSSPAGGQILTYSGALPTTTTIGQEPLNAIFDYALEQNYPNPFNPVTHIEFRVLNPGFVELKIYNGVGQLVRTLLSETKTAGRHSVSWDGKDEVGKQVASGVYLYRLEAKPLSGSKKSFTQSRKMVLLR
jgi:photosystem II stability/assembly factor-like uncharacterized protein